MVNMVNMTIYISSKLFYRFKATTGKPSEGLRKVTCMYGLASLILMSGAARFFIGEPRSTAGTPAESRNLNGSCYFLIFDNHDM